MRRCFEEEEWSSKSDHEPTETEREVESAKMPDIQL
jgi:hypothetical protein